MLHHIVVYVACLCVCSAAENRVVLRCANIVKHVVMFLAEQKYQELHVFAVMLLASCVEDADIVKVVVFIILIFVYLQNDVCHTSAKHGRYRCICLCLSIGL